MTNQTPVTFCFGSAESYNNLTHKDENSVYFISDTDGHQRIYVGGTCYNIDIVEDLDTGTIGNKEVPSTQAVVTQLNKKVDNCALVTSSDTVLPEPLVLNNNTEYRYLNLSSASSITISIPTLSESFLYYSSVVLYPINSSDSIDTFVTASAGNTSIVFLNPDVNLTDKNTLELLFFSNGLDICCIAAASNHEI